MTQETVGNLRAPCNINGTNVVTTREDNISTSSSRSPSKSASSFAPLSLASSTNTIRTSADSSTSARDTSLSEMLAKVPVTESRGSLLSSVTKLLRVLDISETHIMIPALLKDRCEFDAYEMLTLAKILKASILGHNDLVDFYMSESSSQFSYSTTTTNQQASNNRQANENATTNTETATTATMRNTMHSIGRPTTMPLPNSSSEMASNSSASSSELRSSPSRSLSASSSASSTSSLAQPTISNSLETPSSNFSSSRGSSSSADSSMLHDVSDSNYDLTTPDNLSNNCDTIISQTTLPATVAAAMLPGHEHHNHHHHRLDRIRCRQHRNSHRRVDARTADKPVTTSGINSAKNRIAYETNMINNQVNLTSQRARGQAQMTSSSSSLSTRGSAALQIDSQTSPEVTFRLLLHIEQLKTFIPQVTHLFESITELYMSSVEGINH